MIKYIQLFIAITVVEILCLISLLVYTVSFGGAQGREGLASRRELVRFLMLTDFALWTEARYTRHPSQTDFFTPFQDFPSSFEHFPAGSMIAPVTVRSAP